MRHFASPVFRVAAVLLAVTAWIVATNHCALGLMGQQGNAPCAAQCPMHSSAPVPAPNGNSHPMACCSSLRAVLTSAPAAPTFVARDAGELPAAAARVETGLEVKAPQPAATGTSPPEARSFAESVLQESLFEHAPPSAK